MIDTKITLAITLDRYRNKIDFGFEKEHNSVVQDFAISTCMNDIINLFLDLDLLYKPIDKKLFLYLKTECLSIVNLIERQTGYRFNFLIIL